MPKDLYNTRKSVFFTIHAFTKVTKRLLEISNKTVDIKAFVFVQSNEGNVPSKKNCFYFPYLWKSVCL